VWVRPGRGNDTVNIVNAGGMVYVRNTGGQDTVTIGNAGSMQGIAGGLSVKNVPGNDPCFSPTTTLVLDDHADTAARSVPARGSPSPYSQGTSITGLAAGSISFDDDRNLPLNGGRGGNSYDVRLSCYAPPASPIILNTGAGNDRVEVADTGPRPVA